jgi:hypothetical protein
MVYAGKLYLYTNWSIAYQAITFRAGTQRCPRPI